MNFEQFNFHPSIDAAIQKCGYTVPTPIPMQAIPHLVQGHDSLGLAQTGTGKTAAFVLPTLQRLQEGSRKKIRSLILTPTRELAEQIHENIQQMASGTTLRSCTIYGGVSKYSQIKNMERGVEIVVACPGRLLDHINSGSINLANIEILILDEADQMFDQGFLPDIRRILKHVPQKRQSMVFSATMPKEIRHLAENILSTPVTVQVDHEKPAATISHALFQVTQGRKTALLTTILQQKEMSTTLIFTRTKHKAKNLARHLQKEGFKATSLQGNLSQNQRKIAMEGFKTGKFNILVATDIAARGIDIDQLPHVVNYELPNVSEDYVHRIGRTGRAGNNGEAMSIVCIDEHEFLANIEKLIKKDINKLVVKGFAPDPSIKAEPSKMGGGGGNRGRGGNRNGGGNRGGGGNSRGNSRNKPRGRN